MLTYFIQAADGGNIKIGKSTDVQQRLESLQAGSPTKLVLLGTSGEPERDLHAKFAKDRAHGEWFKPSMRLVNYLKSLGMEPRIGLPGAFKFASGDWYDGHELERLWDNIMGLTGITCFCRRHHGEHDYGCDSCLSEAAWELIHTHEYIGAIWDHEETTLTLFYQRDRFGSRSVETTEDLTMAFGYLDLLGDFNVRGVSYSPTSGFRNEQIFERWLYSL